MSPVTARRLPPASPPARGRQSSCCGIAPEGAHPPQDAAPGRPKTTDSTPLGTRGCPSGWRWRCPRGGPSTTDACVTSHGSFPSAPALRNRLAALAWLRVSALQQRRSEDLRLVPSSSPNPAAEASTDNDLAPTDCLSVTGGSSDFAKSRSCRQDFDVIRPSSPLRPQLVDSFGADRAAAPARRAAAAPPATHRAAPIRPSRPPGYHGGTERAAARPSPTTRLPDRPPAEGS